MHIIVGGCGRVGADVSDRLSNDGHDVVVVDTDENSFDRVGSAFNGETLVGDVTDKNLLLRAGIAETGALVAVTNSDNANLMAAEIARELFGVERTVARLFNPERESAYRKMGIQYVSGGRLIAKTILNELHADALPLHVNFDVRTDIEVVEMRVRRAGHGMTVYELEERAKGGLRVAAISGGQRVRVAKSDDRLHVGDIVVAGAHRGTYKKLRELVEHPYAKG